MNRERLLKFILSNTSVVMFALLFVIFGIAAPRFFTVRNAENIVYAASYIGIMAIGMTFVLLTGGIDLSIGSNMYLSSIVAGIAINVWGVPVWIAVAIALGVGVTFGTVNALLITRAGLLPFVATLCTLIAGRGLGLFITRSTSVNFPEGVTMMGSIRVGGVVLLPIVIFLAVLLVSHIFLTRTQIGRQIYAVGFDRDAAAKAGIDTVKTLAAVYVLCGLFAALGGFVSVAQLGRIQPNFGEADELDAIAAAVLGGTSLFGGIGTVLPGTLLGTIMIQMIQAGLVFVNMDLYIQPIVTAAIIFLAVMVDSFRSRQIQRLQRRRILRREE